MKKIFFISFMSLSAMAHDSVLPHNHSTDGIQLSAILGVLVAALALFAVLKKTA